MRKRPGHGSQSHTQQATLQRQDKLVIDGYVVFRLMEIAAAVGRGFENEILHKCTMLYCYRSC